MVTLTLSDILHKLGCPKWDEWCDAKGWSPWCVNEGGGDIEVSMTIDEAKDWGII
jgi:hypothetical protein